MEENGATFLDEAEKIIRTLARRNPKLVVWRGDHAHTFLGSVSTHETIIAGLPNDIDPGNPPKSAMLKAWQDGLANIELSAGTEKDCLYLVPFEEGCQPLKKVADFAEFLSPE